MALRVRGSATTQQAAAPVCVPLVAPEISAVWNVTLEQFLISITALNNAPVTESVSWTIEFSDDHGLSWIPETAGADNMSDMAGWSRAVDASEERLYRLTFGPGLTAYYCDTEASSNSVPVDPP
jgi:hypothetical protein